MHTYAPTTEAGIKAQAQLLKSFLQSKNAPLNHMTCLDAVSVQYGYPSWQHARAALSVSAVNSRSLLEVQEEQEKAVGLLLVEAGSVHESTLRSWAHSLRPQGPQPDFTAEYVKTVSSNGEDVDRDAWLKSTSWVEAKGDLHPTELVSSLRLGFRFEAGVLYVLPEVHLEVLRCGHGPVEPDGYEEGLIEWTCYEAEEEIGVVLADPLWQKKLRSAVHAVPVAELLEKSLEGEPLPKWVAEL